jgi:hypothetical protein
VIFDPEDGGDTFLRNVGSFTDYTALYPRIWQFSFINGVLKVDIHNPEKITELARFVSSQKHGASIFKQNSRLVLF